ncbi:MAG: hypothetical protein U0361_22450 [Nitrospiraceae bacterium]
MGGRCHHRSDSAGTYEHRQNYRDVALFFQDEDNIIGTSFMPYVQNVAGLTGVNYRSEPYKFREERAARWVRCSSLARRISPKIPQPVDRGACG